MDYMASQPIRLLTLTGEHVILTLSGVALATLIGVPLGICISRVRLLATPVLALAGILYTVPSLALFAVLIPVFGLGIRLAVTALVLYALLAIIRNTASGIEAVSPDARDAAIGIGMSSWQRLRLVELPLALPAVVAGLRIATVMSIGVASVAAYIGGGGLGTLIFRGIATVNNDMIVAGALPIAGLALLADNGLLRVERLLHGGRRAKPPAGAAAV
jgi:osmoprotectant transport system permease protein